MTTLDRRSFILATGAAAVCTASCGAGTVGDTYRCPPCGCSSDGIVFDEPGICPDCGMVLEPANESDLGVEPNRLAPLAGVFKVRDTHGRTDAAITVHYFLPDTFTPTSRILLVLPGSGRNSSEYRNLWLESARRTGTLVAALGYPEEQYDFAAYNLGGVARDLVYENMEVERHGRSTVVRMQDEDFQLRINKNPREWLFRDLDRVFALLKSLSGSTRESYAVFGHSAGAQILHRMALFYPESKADDIVAANAGFYTLPDLAEPFPTGLSGTGRTEDDVEKALAVKLTLLLGELDNNDDAGGTILHTPAVDKQGLGRLDRGRTFFSTGFREAQRLGTPFSWQIIEVPDVGHDSQSMVAAASRILL